MSARLYLNQGPAALREASLLIWWISMPMIGILTLVSNLYRGIRARGEMRRRFERRFGRSDLKFLTPRITVIALLVLIFDALQGAWLGWTGSTHRFWRGDVVINAVIAVLAVAALVEVVIVFRTIRKGA